MADGNHWFIAVVTPNTEKSCRDKLDKLFETLNKEKKYDESKDEDQKIISYVPIQRELHQGSKVRVKSGRFAGMEGYLYREPNGSTSIAIAIDFLGSARTEYPIELLELVKE